MVAWSSANGKKAPDLPTQQATTGDGDGYVEAEVHGGEADMRWADVSRGGDCDCGRGRGRGPLNLQPPVVPCRRQGAANRRQRGQRKRLLRLDGSEAGPGESAH